MPLKELTIRWFLLATLYLPIVDEFVFMALYTPPVAKSCVDWFVIGSEVIVVRCDTCLVVNTLPEVGLVSFITRSLRI